MNQQTETADLDDRISNADRLHAQAVAIVDLIGRTAKTGHRGASITNAAWCVEELLDQLKVEHRAIQQVARAVKP